MPTINIPSSVHVRQLMSVIFFVITFLAIIKIYYIVAYVASYSQYPFLNTSVNNINHSSTNCRPQNYIVFIKVHKTGSTSIMNILQRYGLARNLTFILPLINNYLGKQTTLHLSPQILVPPKNAAINILCNHVVYNRTAFRKALSGRIFVDLKGRNETSEKLCSLNLNQTDKKCQPKTSKKRRIRMSDYFFFTMIRRPLGQVLSAVYYYKLFPKVGPGDLMEAILNTPTLFTNNRMSYDLGLSPSHFHVPAKVQEFITGIDTDIHLVLLMEYFDESMILLRRRLCWKVSDILYIKRNTGEHRPRIRVTSEQRERFRQHRAPADSALYDHFRTRFWKAVYAEGSHFFDEVHHYRSILSLVRDYCSYVENHRFDSNPLQKSELEWIGDTENPLTIASTRWHEEFSVGAEECNFMTMEELPLVDHIRKLMYGKIR